MSLKLTFEFADLIELRAFLERVGAPVANVETVPLPVDDLPKKTAKAPKAEPKAEKPKPVEPEKPKLTREEVHVKLKDLTKDPSPITGVDIKKLLLDYAPTGLLLEVDPKHYEEILEKANAMFEAAMLAQDAQSDQEDIF